jgi:hypothetical protein
LEIRNEDVHVDLIREFGHLIYQNIFIFRF